MRRAGRGAGRAPRRVRGRFAFDAVANDASRMFLIQPRPGGHYLVRTYDLVRDELMPGAVIDKLEGEWQMEGEPVARAMPAAAPWVYTLYTKNEGPFVHALNTAGFALCIELPAAARSGSVAARERGLAVDTSTLTVRDTLLPGRRVRSVLASGRRLYAQDGAVVTLDAASGRVMGRTARSAPGATLAAVLPAR
jgi:hypothetical protein